MRKPTDFDTASDGTFTPVAVGGHYCTILKVVETTSSSGRDMLVVAIDFAKEDKQVGYFRKAFDEDTRDSKKWPNNGTAYIMVYDWENDSKTNKDFKAFMTCVEHSNKGFAINWEAKDFGAQFKGKRVGAVYGKVEDEYNGNVRWLRKIRWFCNWDKVEGSPIPKDKLLPENKRPAKPSVPPSENNDTDLDVPF